MHSSYLYLTLRQDNVNSLFIENLPRVCFNLMRASELKDFGVNLWNSKLVSDMLNKLLSKWNNSYRSLEDFCFVFFICLPSAKNIVLIDHNCQPINNFNVAFTKAGNRLIPSIVTKVTLFQDWQFLLSMYLPFDKYSLFPASFYFLLYILSFYFLLKRKRNVAVKTIPLRIIFSEFSI